MLKLQWLVRDEMWQVWYSVDSRLEWTQIVDSIMLVILIYSVIPVSIQPVYAHTHTSTHTHTHTHTESSSGTID